MRLLSLGNRKKLVFVSEVATVVTYSTEMKKRKPLAWVLWSGHQLQSCNRCGSYKVCSYDCVYFLYITINLKLKICCTVVLIKKTDSKSWGDSSVFTSTNAFAEDPGSDPSTHIADKNCLQLQFQEIQHPLLQALQAWVHLYTHRQ